MSGVETITAEQQEWFFFRDFIFYTNKVYTFLSDKHLTYFSKNFYIARQQFLNHNFYVSYKIKYASKQNVRNVSVAKYWGHLVSPCSK